MAITRADAITGTGKKQEYFSDFLDNFDKSPIGDQLARVTNEQAVNQSLRNLIKTNLGERLFQPDVGSNVYASLFEQNDFILNANLKSYVENVIKNNEPRIFVIEVVVYSSLYPNESELLPHVKDGQSVEIQITYTLINNPTPIVLNVILKKVR